MSAPSRTSPKGQKSQYSMERIIVGPTCVGDPSYALIAVSSWEEECSLSVYDLQRAKEGRVPIHKRAVGAAYA